MNTQPAWYVGNTNSSGANQIHLVRDTDTWTAMCGKKIAEAWGVENFDNVTCIVCQKGIK